MLELTTRNLYRRSMLSVGSLALGGLTLPRLLQAKEAVRQRGGVVKDKSVIFLMMHGGPSQFETFDPKMGAPANIRSQTGEIPTKLPGITFGSTFGKLAKLNDKFSIVRSFTTENGGHSSKPLVDSRFTADANLGSHYARIAGTSHPKTGMPRNIVLYPRAVDQSAMPAIMSLGKFNTTGPLGHAYEPFAPSGDGGLKDDMKVRIDPSRLADRRHLLGGIDQWRGSVDRAGATHGFGRFQDQAFQTLTGGVTEAFDISNEDPGTLARYDTSKLMDVSKISKRWNNHQRYRDHVNSLGKLLLLARRLAERGAGFITVTTNFVWDMHADKNNATITEGMDYVGHPFDHAVSAFIEDVEASGLKDKILLVCCGEMGRTPKLNARGGRDHWGGSAPLLLYGGGIKGGHVVGSSTKDGGEPYDNVVRIPNLYATIMDTILDTGTLRTQAGIPDEVTKVLSGGSPIRELL